MRCRRRRPACAPVPWPPRHPQGTDPPVQLLEHAPHAPVLLELEPQAAQLQARLEPQPGAEKRNWEWSEAVARPRAKTPCTPLAQPRRTRRPPVVAGLFECAQRRLSLTTPPPLPLKTPRPPHLSLRAFSSARNVASPSRHPRPPPANKLNPPTCRCAPSRGRAALSRKTAGAARRLGTRR